MYIFDKQLTNMKTFLTILLISASLLSCKEIHKNNQTNKKDKQPFESSSKLNITPISHATAVLEFSNKLVFLDPTGGAKAFQEFNNPDFVVITDIHGDHMNMKTLNELDLKNSTIITCEAVAKEIQVIDVKEVIVIKNGEQKSFSEFSIEAIPMYNLRKDALKFHPKGRGNGYVFTINNERIYFSGDTEDIPEMRSLKNIDKAFVCMNLPYTMTVEKAADAVLDFKPKKVYPYHYRGKGGLSDVIKFKKLVNQGNSSIEVVQFNWYPKKK